MPYTERWIHILGPVGYDELDIAKCAECGYNYYENQLSAVSDDGARLPKYCPTCGAKMIKESEDT